MKKDIYIYDVREKDGVAIADLIFFACHNPTRRAAARRAYEEKRWGDLKRIMEAGVSPRPMHYRRIDEYPHKSPLVVLPLLMHVLFIAYTHPLSTLYFRRNVAGPERHWIFMLRSRSKKARRRAEAMAALPDIEV